MLRRKNWSEQKRSETKFTANVLKKGGKHTRLKRMLFDETKQDRVQIFYAVLFVETRTLQKQTNNLSAAGWGFPAT